MSSLDRDCLHVQPDRPQNELYNHQWPTQAVGLHTGDWRRGTLQVLRGLRYHNSQGDGHGVVRGHLPRTGWDSRWWGGAWEAGRRAVDEPATSVDSGAG